MDVSQYYSVFATAYRDRNASAFGLIPDLIEKYFHELPTPSLVLDAGCGPGIEASIGSALGHRIIGVDFAPNMVSLFKERLPNEECLEASLEKLPLHFNHVDASKVEVSVVGGKGVNAEESKLSAIFEGIEVRAAEIGVPTLPRRVSEIDPNLSISFEHLCCLERQPRYRQERFAEILKVYDYWYKPTKNLSQLSTIDRPKSFKEAIDEVMTRLRQNAPELGRVWTYTFPAPNDVFVVRTILEGAELFGLVPDRKGPIVKELLR